MGRAFLYSFVLAIVILLLYFGLIIGDAAEEIANEEVTDVMVENTLDSKYSKHDDYNGELHYCLIIKINNDDNDEEEITEEVNETIYNLYKKDDHVNLLFRTIKKKDTGEIVFKGYIVSAP